MVQNKGANLSASTGATCRFSVGCEQKQNQTTHHITFKGLAAAYSHVRPAAAAAGQNSSQRAARRPGQQQQLAGLERPDQQVLLCVLAPAPQAHAAAAAGGVLHGVQEQVMRGVGVGVHGLQCAAGAAAARAHKGLQSKDTPRFSEFNSNK